MVGTVDQVLSSLGQFVVEGRGRDPPACFQGPVKSWRVGGANLGRLVDNQGVRLSFSFSMALIGFLCFFFSNFLLNLMSFTPPRFHFYS